MALNYSTTYPTQTSSADPNYPYGKAQNRTSQTDNNGTPRNDVFVNDDLGFKQALLVEAGITPSNSPDHANSSQYLDAGKKIFQSQACRYRVTGSNLGSLDDMTLTEIFSDDIFSEANSVVTLSKPGLYRFSLAAFVTTDVNLQDVAIGARVIFLENSNSQVAGTFYGVRVGITVSRPANVTGSFVHRFTEENVLIRLRPRGEGILTVTTPVGAADLHENFCIERIGD